jgi:hypothetical protein
MISTIAQSPRSLPPPLPPRFLSTTRRFLSTTRRPPPHLHAECCAECCAELLSFEYAFPAITLSVFIRLTWGLKWQITYRTLHAPSTLRTSFTTLHFQCRIFKPSCSCFLWMKVPGFSLQGEEKDEARLRKHDLKLCVCLTGRVPDASTFSSTGVFSWCGWVWKVIR